MRKKKALIVGGTGQIGLYLSKYLLSKNYLVCVTTRKLKKNTIKKVKFLGLYKKIKFKNLKSFTIKNIEKIFFQFIPDEIYYLAGQSYPSKSFLKKKETIKSNTLGCKNFLKIIRKNSSKCKFFNSSSSEIFGNQKKVININSRKNPVNPYGKAKLISYNITKEYRNKYKVSSYNGIIFNTESYLRPKNFLIPKICLAAIGAAKNKNKFYYFGNLNISREWNWCDEQVKLIWKFLQKKPQDFLLSNGRIFTAKEMLTFAFKYFGLDYRKFIKISNAFKRPKDITFAKSNLQKQFKNDYKIYGKKLITKLIKFYINNNYDYK